MFQLIQDAFHHPKTRTYRVVNTVVWTMIVLSIIIFAIDLYRGINNPHPVLEAIDNALVALFAVEVTLRVASYRPPSLDMLRHSPRLC